ncbi:MAG TPA: hypothetical protein VIL66_02250 [Bacillota bacterium]
MDITQSLTRLIKTYQNHFGSLFVSTLIACTFSLLSCGFLAGPFLGGLLLYNLRLWQGRRGNLTTATKEVFSHFDLAFPCLLLSLFTGLLWSLISLIGHIPFFGVLFVFLFHPLLFFFFCLALLFIIDKRYTLIPALTGASRIFLTNTPNIAFYGLITGLLGLSGAFFLILPVILTIPLTFLAAALAYYELSATAPALPRIDRHTMLIVSICITVLILAGAIFKYSGQ